MPKRGWFRRLFCKHRSTTQIQDEWGIAWRCEDCGESEVRWS